MLVCQLDHEAIASMGIPMKRLALIGDSAGVGRPGCCPIGE